MYLNKQSKFNEKFLSKNLHSSVPETNNSMTRVIDEIGKVMRHIAASWAKYQLQVGGKLSDS
jgi:hypothetical protein